jgi:integrase
MSYISPSRVLLGRTLADVLAAVETASNLSKVDRQNMASAVRTVARLLHRPVEQIPAEPEVLARRLQEISPIANGLSKGHWANVRSRLNAALALTQPVLPGRHRTPLSPAWQSLSDSLVERRVSWCLSRLLHWLSARGIEPHAVTKDDLTRFSEELRHASLAKDPKQIWHTTAWAWNQASGSIPGWPPFTIVGAERKNTYSLPWEAFPTSLKADVYAYLRRLTGDDLLEEIPFRPVRKSTRDYRETQFRRFASALVCQGRDPKTICSMADLVNLDAFKLGLRYLLGRHGDQKTISTEYMATTLKYVAQHWVKVDDATLGTMTAIIKNKLSVKKRGMTEKNRNRLRPFNDPATVAALLLLPERLMKLADSGKYSPLKSALLAQTAVAIEILLMVAIRRENLAQLHLDRHLLREGRDRKQLSLVLTEDEVKNDIFLEYPLEEEAIALIDRYLDRHWPVLATSGCRALFPGRDAESKSSSRLSLQINKAVFTYTGLTVNLHLFRHIAGKLLLDEKPGAYGTLSQVLGHKSINTTKDYYTGMETAAAARHFQKTIIELRKSLRRGGK